MKVERILETAMYVDDLQAADAFYAGVLGLEQFAHESGRHTFYRCGTGVLLLFNPEGTRSGSGEIPAHGATGAGHVAFAVDADDIPAWRVQLAEHDVKVEAEVDWPGGGRSVYFRDHAGNSIELTTPATWGLPTD